MSLFESIMLALIQGVSEFVPISSSGHLVAVRELFGWSDENGVFLDVMLHAASLLAILVYFRREWMPLLLSVFFWKDAARREERMYVFQLAVATVPVLVAGLLVRSHLDLLRNGLLVGVVMMAVALWFLVCETWHRDWLPGMTFTSAIIMGLAQTMALLPGASRSGLTISAGVLSGQPRVRAARFSFLMVIPPIAGATLLESRKLPEVLGQEGCVTTVAISFLVCFVASYASIHFCLRLFRRISLNWFALYLLGLGGLLIGLHFLG